MILIFILALPGVKRFDFRVKVDAGVEECFYQKMSTDTNIYISFQVTKSLKNKFNKNKIFHFKASARRRYKFLCSKT